MALRKLETSGNFMIGPVASASLKTSCVWTTTLVHIPRFLVKPSFSTFLTSTLEPSPNPTRGFVASVSKSIEWIMMGFEVGYNTCFYHPHRRPPPSGKYLCCGKKRLGLPCAKRNFHCTEDIDPYQLNDFIYSSKLSNMEAAVYAVDCEFVQMKRGLALAQIVMVDHMENCGDEWHYPTSRTYRWLPASVL